MGSKLLDEPCLTEKALGDRRCTSVDARSTTVGCVSDEQIVGKIVFRVWPLPDFGALR